MRDDAFHLVARAQAAYARCIDEGPLESWPEFFDDECFYQVTTADNHRDGLEAGLIWADSRGMLTDRISALREANVYERHTYRHLLGQPHLTPTATMEEVDSETPFLVVRTTRDGTSDIFATGRYLDRYRLGADDAHLTRRVVVCDSSRVDTLLALPL